MDDLECQTYLGRANERDWTKVAGDGKGEVVQSEADREHIAVDGSSKCEWEDTLGGMS